MHTDKAQAELPIGSGSMAKTFMRRVLCGKPEGQLRKKYRSAGDPMMLRNGKCGFGRTLIALYVCEPSERILKQVDAVPLELIADLARIQRVCDVSSRATMRFELVTGPEPTSMLSPVPILWRLTPKVVTCDIDETLEWTASDRAVFIRRFPSPKRVERGYSARRTAYSTFLQHDEGNSRRQCAVE